MTLYRLDHYDPNRQPRTHHTHINDYPTEAEAEAAGSALVRGRIGQQYVVYAVELEEN